MIDVQQSYGKIICKPAFACYEVCHPQTSSGAKI